MKDWFIETIGNPAFTLEMGIGQNPLAWQQFDGIYNKAREMLLLFAVAM
jgi:g-D-glutamyl-meso-diaminopimelate peptidase